MFQRLKLHQLIGFSLAVMVPLGSAWAQETADQDWPCQQRLVPKIAAAQLWSGPALPEEKTVLTAPPDISDLGRSVMSPTISDAQATKMLTDYKAHLKSAKKFKAVAPTLFLIALTEANSRREEQISGIKRFTQGQFALSRKLADDVNELDKQTMGQPAKDGTPAMDLENQVHMEQKVFEDREKQVKFLCDTPAGDEQRLGLVAHVLQTALEAK